MSDFRASLVNDNIRELAVCLEGPKDSLYEGGVWKIHVEIPDQYPYKSPSIGFETKIFHPNIDEQSGSVCLDVINQTWSPMFTMIHIFETFIPQLLNYPNASDPLNGDASSLYLNNRKLYEEKVKSYVQKYANRSEVLHKFNVEMGLDDVEGSELRAGSRNTYSEMDPDDDMSSIDNNINEKENIPEQRINNKAFSPLKEVTSHTINIAADSDSDIDMDL